MTNLSKLPALAEKSGSSSARNGKGAARSSKAATLSGLTSGGRSLEGGVRTTMEKRFGRNFSDVRVHDDAASHASSGRLKAEAFTFGQHIHFASGTYRPHSSSGLNLLAHELAHTAQQRHAATPSRLGVGGSRSPFEREADAAASRAMAGQPVGPIRQAPDRIIMRRGSDEIADINDLLSYGLFDWKIRDAEAVEALTRLKGLPRIKQAEFMSDTKYSGRLRDNLPDDRVAEFDAIAADVRGLVPGKTTLDAMIDKLSYGVFDWAITDAEAVEALELLKGLPPLQLAVALKRIDYQRLLDNLPENRKVEMIDLLAAGLGSSGSFAGSEKTSPGAALRSLDFTSDHGVMRNNDKDWSDTGPPFEQPDWTVDESGKVRTSPISHTMGEAIGIELGFDVAPADAKSSSVELTGKGSSPFLDFAQTVTLGGGRGKRVRMTSSNKLPKAVTEHRDQSIDWTIKWGTWQHSLGVTGPFDIFATVSTPARSDNVTTRRMAKAVEFVGNAPSLKPHDVVQDIAFKWTNFNLDVIYANEWELAANIEKGAQCIDLVRFIQAVIGMVGLPGTAEAVQIWAMPSSPMTAIESPYRGGGMYMVPPRPDGSSAALLDGDFRPNNFEAALKFSHDGKLRYYPGGVQNVIDDPNKVLLVFECLAWIRGVRGSIYEIVEIPGQYRPRAKVGDRYNAAGGN
ncbi:MAG TPA: DUF4157 domain-containing protein [Kaistia sp.]|nr:DUF4157 domain-containing protein [Kaistia sp.]